MKKLLIAVLICLAFFACTKKQANEVHVFNWSEYIPDEVIKQFEKESGIKVVYSTYDSNEAMYSKIKVLDGEGYDVIFPSSYFMQKMSDEKLIQPIDHTKVTNFKYFDEKLLNQDYDKGNVYSVPFMWGSTALAVNAKYVDPKKVTSWKDLWNPEYKGKVMLTNDVREVFHMALRILGYSGNTRDEKEISAAYDELKKLMPSVRLFNSDSPKVPFLNEEVYIGMMWNGEAFRADMVNPDIVYIYPKEGAAIWIDNIAIPSKAKNVDNAHKFIDFLSRPDVSAQISNSVGYTSPVTKAADYLDNATKESRIVYPNDEDMKNSEVQQYVGDAILVYDKYWEKLRTKN